MVAKEGELVEVLGGMLIERTLRQVKGKPIDKELWPRQASKTLGILHFCCHEDLNMIPLEALQWAGLAFAR